MISRNKEYADFLHPEESKRMRDIVIDVSIFFYKIFKKKSKIKIM